MSNILAWKTGSTTSILTPWGGGEGGEGRRGGGEGGREGGRKRGREGEGKGMKDSVPSVCTVLNMHTHVHENYKLQEKHFFK